MVVPTETSDEALAARAAAGDDSAFEAIVGRYQGRVFRLACRLTSDTDAPDVLQDTFLQVYRHLASFRGESKFGTWLYRIASNVALMHRRAVARRPAESLDEFLPRFDAEGKHAATPAELRVASRADELLDRQLLAERARDVLARLPDLYRDAFVLRDLEEMSTADVARALGVEPATVRQRVHRARLMLRGYLSDLAGVQPSSRSPVSPASSC
jgi:RNA polymerase sigma-70 factor (ECF subfamily)